MCTYLAYLFLRFNFFRRLHKMFSNSSLTWNIVLLLMASFPAALLLVPLLEAASSMPAAAHAGSRCHCFPSSANLLVLKYILHQHFDKNDTNFFSDNFLPLSEWCIHMERWAGWWSLSWHSSPITWPWQSAGSQTWKIFQPSRLECWQKYFAKIKILSFTTLQSIFK